MIGIDGLFVDGLSIATVRSGSSHVVNKKKEKEISTENDSLQGKGKIT